MAIINKSKLPGAQIVIDKKSINNVTQRSQVLSPKDKNNLMFGQTSSKHTKHAFVENESLIKPPYIVPSMDDVRKATGKNGLNVVSTFSGAGGSCMGWRLAGYKVIWANDIVPHAIECYRTNFPNVHMNTNDIRTITGCDIMNETGLEYGSLDLLESSPPCKSWATIGKKEKGWNKNTVYSGSVYQSTNDLLYHFSRLVHELNPRVACMENVRGLLCNVSKGYFIELMERLEKAGSGYIVRCALLDAQYLGCASKRSRVIFILVRKDIGIEPQFPSPKPYRYTLADIFPYMREIYIPSSKSYGEGRSKYCSATRDSTIPVLKAFGIGPVFCGEHKVILMDGSPDRRLTVSELKKIASFPEDYILQGSYWSVWERMGRSFLPLLCKSVAESIYSSVFAKM